jgi:hypothetical protein
VEKNLAGQVGKIRHHVLGKSGKSAKAKGQARQRSRK